MTTKFRNKLRTLWLSGAFLVAGILLVAQTAKSGPSTLEDQAPWLRGHIESEQNRLGNPAAAGLGHALLAICE